MGLQIFLFGHLRIAMNDHPIPQRLRPRASRLLAFLLLHRYQALPRERVAFDLWSDTTEPIALSNLRRALSEIQNALPPNIRADCIISSGGNIQWNSQTGIWLDVDEYERGARQERPESWQAAADLYEGHLLAEFGDAWVIVERERLYQLQCDLLRKLAFHFRSRHQIPKALELAARLVQYDPLAEIACRELIALHYMNGDRASALSVFNRMKENLARELKVEPMAETLAMMEAIMRGETLPVSSFDDPTSVTNLYHPEDINLIGRQPELNELNKIWSEITRGHGRQVLMSGASGVGKTHLVKKFAGDISRRGGLVLLGQCHDFGKSIPFFVLRAALLAMQPDLTKLQLAPHQAAILNTAFAKISPQPEDDSELNTSQVGGTYPDLLEAILQSFLFLSRKRPLLLIIEDAHWAGEATLDWLTYVSGRLHDCRILIVVTYLADEIHANHALTHLQNRLTREKKLMPLLLKPFSPAENLARVCQLSGLPEAQAAPLSERLYLETEGNPFFLEELVRGLIESGEIRVEDGVWRGRFVEHAPDTQIHMPESLIATILSRVDRLSNEGREFITTAAVAGRQFLYGVVHRANGRSEESALRALEELLSRQLVVEEKTPARDLFSFAHHLIQEAILSRMPAPKKVYLHSRIGNAIKDLYPHTPERYGELAYHSFHGHKWEDAACYAVESGERAAAAYADQEAMQYFEQALHALRHLNASPEQRFDFLAHRLRVEERLGEYDRITESLAEMERLARQANDPALLARALFGRGRFLRLVGPVSQARELLAESVQLCEVISDSEFLAQSLVELSQADFALLSIPESLAAMERALDICRHVKFSSEAERNVQYAVALRAKGAIYGRMGRSQASLDILEESLTVLREVDKTRVDEIAFTQIEQGWIYQSIGETTRHLPILKEAVDTLQKVDFRGAMINAHTLQLAIQLGMQNKPLDEAREILPQLNRWQSRPDLKGTRLGMLAWYEMMSGNMQNAVQDAKETISLFRKAGNLNELLLFLPVMSLIQLALNDFESALESSTEGVALLGDKEHFTQMTINFAHFRALQATGRHAESLIYLQRSYEALKIRIEDFTDPALRQAAYDQPLNVQIISAWRERQS